MVALKLIVIEQVRVFQVARHVVARLIKVWKVSAIFCFQISWIYILQQGVGHFVGAEHENFLLGYFVEISNQHLSY